MTIIRETDLPVIGRKFQMSTRSGDQLVIGVGWYTITLIKPQAIRTLFLIFPEIPLAQLAYHIQLWYTHLRKSGVERVGVPTL